jgi:phosphomevalonate kinase
VSSFENAVKSEFCVQRKIDLAKFCADPQLREIHKDALRDFLLHNTLSLEQICKRTIDLCSQRSPSVIVITDVRHPAEISAMRKITPRLFTIRVNSSDAARIKRGWISNSRHDVHVTETALDTFPGFNATFQNDSNSGHCVLKWFSEDLFVKLVCFISAENPSSIIQSDRVGASIKW